MTPIEEEYEDILQNIESAIVSVYREHPDLVDYDVEKVLNVLIALYRAEQINRTPPPREFSPLAQQVYERVQYMCEWRLGRKRLGTDEIDQELPQPPPLTLDEIMACLKRIRKSVQKWNRRGGRQGYLQFVSEFIV